MLFRERFWITIITSDSLYVCHIILCRSCFSSAGFGFGLPSSLHRGFNQHPNHLVNQIATYFFLLHFSYLDRVGHRCCHSFIILYLVLGERRDHSSPRTRCDYSWAGWCSRSRWCSQNRGCMRCGSGSWAGHFACDVNDSESTRGSTARSEPSEPGRRTCCCT